MSTEKAQRCCRFSEPDGSNFIEVTIIDDDFVMVDMPNMMASGSVRCFELIIMKRSDTDTDDERIGCLVAERGLRVHISLTLEQVAEIHATIPEIAFKDYRAEVQS